MLYLLSFFIFHFSSKNEQWTETKIGERGKMTLTQQELRSTISEIHKGVLEGGGFYQIYNRWLDK